MSLFFKKVRRVSLSKHYSSYSPVKNSKEQYEREKRKKDVIRGTQEEESGNALSLAENITKFFEDCIAMCDVMIYGAH